MNNFETYMNKYKESLWCLKNQDSILNLCNLALDELRSIKMKYKIKQFKQNN